MFTLGIVLLWFGYVLLYTGAANLLNGGQGPTLSESVGLSHQIAPPSKGAVVGAIQGGISR